MATHEWQFEDLIHDMEFDEQDNQDSNNSFHGSDGSCSPVSDQVPSSQTPLSATIPEAGSDNDQNVSSGTLSGYELKSTVSEPVPNLELPSSLFEDYHTPLSYPNVGNNTAAAVPRTDLNALFDSTGMPIDDETNSLPNLNVAMVDCQSGVEPEGTTSPSQPYTPTDTDTSLSYGASDLLPSFQPRSSCLEASANYIYPPLGACGNPYGKFAPQPDPLIMTDYTLPVNSAQTTLLSWGYASLLNCQSSGSNVDYPVGSTQTKLNDGTFVSPSQILNIHPASSPDLPSSPASTLWPPQDLLFSAQPQLSSAVQMPQPILSPSNGPAYSQAVQTPHMDDSDDIDGYQTTLQFARGRWSGAGLGDQRSRDAALLEMRQLGLSYKDIKKVGCFTDALPTLRGRHRILTTKSEDRVRKPPWQPRDEMLLRQAVHLQLTKPRARETQRIIWKEVANYVKEHGASYNFSYVTCSQKWSSMVSNPLLFGTRARTRAIRGRGAFNV